jgi:hypothetical protein
MDVGAETSSVDLVRLTPARRPRGGRDGGGGQDRTANVTGANYVIDGALIKAI